MARTPSDLRLAAARRAVEVLQEKTHAVAAYRDAVALHNALADAADQLAVDQTWSDATLAEAVHTRDKLIRELRLYQNNGIAESVRMAHQDLGDHYRTTGEHAESLLHYEKTREYCTTNEQALDMYLRAMEAAWDLQQYPTVLTYADKAEAILTTLVDMELAQPGRTEAWRATLANGTTSSGSAAIRALFQAGTSSSVSKPEQDKQGTYTDVLARVAALRTMAQWSQSDLRTSVPPVVCNGKNAAAYSDLIQPTLLAWYAVLSVLCAPLSVQRCEAEQLAQHAEFVHITESDPTPREVLQAYLASDFRGCLAQLEAHRLYFQLDPVLGTRTDVLLDTVAQRMLARYLTAFERTSLAALARAFPWEAPRTHALLVQSVATGAVRAQIDWQAQTVTVASPRAGERSSGWAEVVQAAQVRERMTLVQRMVQAKYVKKLTQHDCAAHDGA